MHDHTITIHDVYTGNLQVGAAYFEALESRQRENPDGAFLRLTPLTAAAIILANHLHRGQRRKGPAKLPYITHPLQVAEYVAQFGGSLDQQAAALLHDVVEDCGYLPEELRDDFSPLVAEYVMDVTEDMSLRRHESTAATWQARKQETIDRMQHVDEGSLLIKACDLLHNTRDLVTEFEYDPSHPASWMHGGLEKRIWYSREIWRTLQSRLNNGVVTELDGALIKLESFL